MRSKTSSVFRQAFVREQWQANQTAPHIYFVLLGVSVNQVGTREKEEEVEEGRRDPPFRFRFVRAHTHTPWLPKRIQGGEGRAGCLLNTPLSREVERG